jgi:phospholipid/cholesterol/gamma-HCH transport system ATP-binding protein
MIRFEQVEKSLGGKQVLDGIDFQIRRGTTAAVVGLSGAGKSVTVKHMIRLLTPDAGRVLIDGEDISHAGPAELTRLRSRFGVLFQGAALLQWMTVRDNVALPLREHTDLDEDEIEAKVEEKLRLVNLLDAMEKYPADLSGGMQKRAGLARAVIMDPEIILYDEPTSGLDPVTSRRIDALIEETREKLGVTSVVITHDLHSALSIASQILMIHGGRIVADASPQAFIESENETVRSFLESQYITRRGRWEKGQNNE